MTKYIGFGFRKSACILPLEIHNKIRSEIHSKIHSQIRRKIHSEIHSKIHSEVHAYIQKERPSPFWLFTKQRHMGIMFVFNLVGRSKSKATQLTQVLITSPNRMSRMLALRTRPRCPTSYEQATIREATEIGCLPCHAKKAPCP